MQRTHRRIPLSFVRNGSRPVTKVLLRLSAKGSDCLPLRFRFTFNSVSRRWLRAVLSSILSPPLWVVVILILVITTYSVSTFQRGPALITVFQEQSGVTSMWPRASETVGSHFILLSSPGRLRSVRGVGFLAYKKFIL